MFGNICEAGVNEGIMMKSNYVKYETKACYLDIIIGTNTEKEKI